MHISQHDLSDFADADCSHWLATPAPELDTPWWQLWLDNLADLDPHDVVGARLKPCEPCPPGAVMLTAVTELVR